LYEHHPYKTIREIFSALENIMCIIKYNKNVNVHQTLNQFVENDLNKKLINNNFQKTIKSKLEFFNKFTL
jgi:hypothetical protein